jgi:hypothetical protein
MPSQTSLTGVAGEHHVLSELLRRGYIAALAPAGVPTADIVVTNRDATWQCAIQVKTRRGIGTDGGWHMSKKHETIRGERLFYCFVDFLDSYDARPIVYVLPASVVAEAITEAHQQWLNGKATRNDGPMRRLLPDYSKVWVSNNPYPSGWLEKYRDAWGSLGLASIDPDHPVEESQTPESVPMAASNV